MKNIRRICMIITMVLITAAILPVQTSGQSRKEKREARKEARMLEKAIRDSIRVNSYGNEDINVGYGRVKRRNLTTSVSKVPVDDNTLGSYTNIGEYLMGRVPGLSVSKVGDEYKYVVRGVNTIYGSTDPLFLVDGVEVTNIDFLNPRDVKSVEVLKDASASIYGTRGACGVILITTKR